MGPRVPSYATDEHRCVHGCVRVCIICTTVYTCVRVYNVFLVPYNVYHIPYNTYLYVHI